MLTSVNCSFDMLVFRVLWYLLIKRLHVSNTCIYIYTYFCAAEDALIRVDQQRIRESAHGIQVNTYISFICSSP